MDVKDSGKKFSSLAVFIGIFEIFMKKCVNFHFEAPEIESSQCHVLFSITCRFLKTQRLGILRTYKKMELEDKAKVVASDWGAKFV